MYIRLILFIHSSLGHLGFFHPLVTVNNAALKMGVQMRNVILMVANSHEHILEQMPSTPHLTNMNAYGAAKVMWVI